MGSKIEEWRDVPNYEGYYQASNFGRVRSLDRTIEFSDGRKRFYKGRIIKGSITKDGYKQTGLSINGIGRNFTFSQIVAMTFLEHEPSGVTMVVDHINGDISDNRVENLRIVTNRANVSTCFRSDRDSFTSEYVGSHWSKSASKWQALIRHNGVQTNLGYYDTEIEASDTYQSALSKIENGSFDPDDYKPKLTSKYNGVYFHKATNKWRSQITINGKNKHLGYFPTEILAHQAYQAKLKEIGN